MCIVYKSFDCSHCLLLFIRFVVAVVAAAFFVFFLLLPFVHHFVRSSSFEFVSPSEMCANTNYTHIRFHWNDYDGGGGSGGDVKGLIFADVCTL